MSPRRSEATTTNSPTCRLATFGAFACLAITLAFTGEWEGNVSWETEDDSGECDLAMELGSLCEVDMETGDGSFDGGFSAAVCDVPVLSTDEGFPIGIPVVGQANRLSSRRP